MHIKFIKQFLVVIFVISILASCTKDEPIVLENPETNEEVRLNDESTMQNLLKSDFEVKEEDAIEATKRMCFELNFPLDIVYPDRTTTSVDNFEALEISFNTWYEENRGTTEEPMLNFPVEVTLMDGTIESITDESALLGLMKECLENKNVVGRKCFEINFPVEIIIDGQNEALAVNSATDFESLLKSRDEKINYEFIFPISITLKKGEVKTLESNEDFKEVKEYCNKKGKGDEDKDEMDWEDVHHNFEFDFLRNECFKIEFPVSFTLQDGNTVTADGYEAIFETIAEQVAENNGEFKELAIAYPLTVTLNADRTTVTLNSEDELKGLYEACRINWDDDKDNDDKDEDWEMDADIFESEVFELLRNRCFEVQLPISITTKAGNVVEFESYEGIMETLMELFRNNEVDVEDITVNYPITIILKDGATETITSEEDFEKVIEACEDNRGQGWGNNDDDDDRDEDWGFDDFDFDDFDFDDFDFDDFDFDDFDFGDFELGDFELGDFDLEGIMFEDFDLSQFDFSNFQDLGDFKIFCFEINFPIAINVSNEERISVESFGDLMQQMFEVILTSRGEDIEPEVNYPITVTMEDGTIKTINTNDEFEELAKNCDD